MHVYACSHDMHILYGCVHTRGTTMLHTIAAHMCARWASFEWQTYFSISVNFVFFFFFFFWFSSGFVFCWICLSMRFCLFIHFFQCCFFRFCSYTLKFERATTWWISWKRGSLFLPILRKLLSMFVHVKWCWWHTARDNLSIDHKMYIFYEQLLGVHCSGFFFLIKCENSLMHGLSIFALLCTNCWLFHVLVHARFVPWICQFIWWLHFPWNSQLRTAERHVAFWREYTTLAKNIETAARTWHRRVIYQACTRLCLACVPVSIFLARVVLWTIIKHVFESECFPS